MPAVAPPPPPRPPPAPARPLPLALLEMALPVILASISQTLMGLADTLMVGRLGNAALAAVGVATLLFSALAMTLKAADVAVQTLTARRVGAGQELEVGRVVATALTVALAAGLLGAAAGLPGARGVLGLVSGDAEVRRLGLEYLRWRLPGLPPLLLFFLLRAAFDGVGWTRIGMLLGIGMNLVNVPLNWLLIFGGAGLPPLGVAGAALASTLSGALAAGAILLVALRRPLRRRFQLLHRRNLDPRLLGPLLRLAWPAALQQLGLLLALLCFFAILGRISTVAVAAGNVVLRIASLAFMAGLGVAVAVQTMVGQALGRGDPRAARRAGWAGAGMALLVMGAFGALFMAAPAPLLRLFAAGPALVAEGAPALRLVGAAQCFAAVALALAGALRGAGETRAVMMIDVISGWLFFLPVSYLFGVVLAGGLRGAFYGVLLWLFLYAAGAAMWFVKGDWQRSEV